MDNKLNNIQSRITELMDLAEVPDSERDIVASKLFEFLVSASPKFFPPNAIIETSHIATIGQRNIPSQAPAIWKDDKLQGDTPPDFIKRHYSPWLHEGGGLIRPDIKKLDLSLYMALNNWLRTNQMPDDLYLPTLKERNDELLAAYINKTIDIRSSSFGSVANLLSAANRRKNQKPAVEQPSRDIPQTVPAQWREDRLANETPPQFIKRHYEPWLGKDLKRADILHLDPPLYRALREWEKSNLLPEDCPLPAEHKGGRPPNNR